MNGTVLIVENEPLVREAMEDILSADGLKAIATSNGRDCIATYRAWKHEIELVILDMRLPGMDGPSILRILRGINPSVKAIVSSGYDEQAILRGFGNQVVAGILRKPFSADALLATVYFAIKH